MLYRSPYSPTYGRLHENRYIPTIMGYHRLGQHANTGRNRITDHGCAAQYPEMARIGIMYRDFAARNVNIIRNRLLSRTATRQAIESRAESPGARDSIAHLNSVKESRANELGHAEFHLPPRTAGGESAHSPPVYHGRIDGALPKTASETLRKSLHLLLLQVLTPDIRAVPTHAYTSQG